MNQRGFILPALPLAAWGGIGAAVVILGLGVAVKVQTARLDAVKQEFLAFQTQVKTLGEAAKQAAKLQEAADKLRKEKADADHKKDADRIAALARQLRDARSRSSYLPPAPASSRSPDTACFGRADLERAIKQLDDGVSGIAEKGDQGIAGLNSARRWAQGR